MSLLSEYTLIKNDQNVSFFTSILHLSGRNDQNDLSAASKYLCRIELVSALRIWASFHVISVLPNKHCKICVGYDGGWRSYSVL
jgi:hypothetical protein